MKTKIITLSGLIALTAFARMIVPFPGWDRLVKGSPDIVVVQVGDLNPLDPKVDIANGARFDVRIKVLSILKSTNSPAARLQTDHELHFGEAYLIFGHYDNGIYKAYEDYKAVPLEHFN